jgi:hypothetical protein
MGERSQKVGCQQEQRRLQIQLGISSSVSSTLYPARFSSDWPVTWSHCDYLATILVQSSFT